MTTHSPTPWRIVRSEVPYFTWIADREHGVVAIGFGAADECVLLHAADLLHAVEGALVAMDAGRLGQARRLLTAARDACGE